MSETYDREFNLCGLLLTTERDEWLAMVRQRVEPKDFTDPDLANVFEAICLLADDGKPWNAATVGIFAHSRGADVRELTAELLDVMFVADTERSVIVHADAIRTSAHRYRVQRGLEKAASAVAAGQPLEDVSAAVFSVLSAERPGDGNTTNGFQPASRIVGSVLASLIERESGRDGALKSGWPSVDRATGGFRKGDLVILAGVPGVGKTALALQLALNALDQGVAVGMVSAEMPAADVIERAACNLSDLDTRRVRESKTLSPDEMGRLTSAIKDIGRSPLYVDDSPCPDVAEVVGRCRALKAQHKAIGVIIVDYLQLLTGDGDENRAEELRAVAYGLKGLAKSAGVPVIALAQLNDKNLEMRGDKRPTLADLQGTSGIRQAGNFIGLLYRPFLYDPLNASPHLLEVNFAKCTHVAPFRVDLTAEYAKMRITDPASNRTSNAAPLDWSHK